MRWRDFWKATGVFVGGFIAGNLSTFFDIFRYYDDKPSILVGYVQRPDRDVRVLLNNGAQEQLVDQNNGFFRFDNLARGTHNLRFESANYHPFSQAVKLDGPGENELPSKVSLRPVTSAAGPVTAFKVVAIAVNYSADGSEPLDANQDVVTTGVVAMYKSNPTKDFWVHVGTKSDTGIVEGGSVTFDGGAASGLVGALGNVEKITVTRTSAPRKHVQAGGYRLGSTTGRLEPGQQIVVTDVDTPSGTDEVWARARVVPEDG